MYYRKCGICHEEFQLFAYNESQEICNLCQEKFDRGLISSKPLDDTTCFTELTND